MGILNINDDSFSSDGKLDPSWAKKRAIELILDGADVIDVGAESARTNREAISIDEEIARFRGFLEQWEKVVEESKPRDEEQLWPPLLSVNTWRTEVIRELVQDRQVDLVNDMSAMQDEKNAVLCRDFKKGLLLMHSVGVPKISHTHVKWTDVVSSCYEFFDEKLRWCRELEVPEESLILDPGFGFAKSAEDDRRLLASLEKLHYFGRPLLVPVGRKGFLGETLNISDPKELDAATIGALSIACRRGAHLYRVHDVRACFEALKVLTALPSCGHGTPSMVNS